MIVEKLSNSELRFHGNSIQFLKGLASVLNFDIDLHFFTDGAGVILPNGTATGLMRRAIDREVDLIVGLLSLQKTRMEHLSETQEFYHDDIIVVVPPPVLIGPITKLLLPLDYLTWIGVLSLLAVSCLVITILRLLPRKLHSMIIGENLQSPYLAVVEVLLERAKPDFHD